MKATEAKLLDFLKKSPQFVIPIYQRTYSWTEKECRQLWDDIVRSGAERHASRCILSARLFTSRRLSPSHASGSRFLVIDGQQRLTTVSLLHGRTRQGGGESEPFDGFSVAEDQAITICSIHEERRTAIQAVPVAN